jgi:repressor LexA
METLTKKQKQILDFIKKFIKQKGYSPSLEETAQHFKLAISTVHEHMENLEKEGYIIKKHNSIRSICINKSMPENFVNIPIIGTIMAFDPEKYKKNPPKTYFALKVKGNEMSKDGISNGAIVVVKRKN